VKRRCILVLGMHRSGTSALTGMLGLLGASLPRETMPPAADNPRGYWESPRLARFNNRLLLSAGTRWNDERVIPAAWFAEPAREADRAEAVQLLATEFPGDDTFVCKDPRLCRLLPFWLPTFAAAGIEPYAVLVFRDPIEIARSLAARAASEAFRPAAIVAPERSVLLWLRHLIDAERQSRDLARQAVEYQPMLTDWRTAIAPLVAAGILEPPSEAIAAAVERFLDSSLNRQTLGSGPRATFSEPVLMMIDRIVSAWRADLLLPSTGAAAAASDALAPALDRLVTAYASLRNGLEPQATTDPWASAILDSLARLTPAAPSTTTGRAVFLSGVPTAIGHVLRVEHPVAALVAEGWDASWLPVSHPAVLARVAEADMVVTFRAAWDDRLAEVARVCARQRMPLVYDVDDLIFDPILMANGSLAVLAALPDHDRRQFIAAADGHRRMLERCSAAVLSTRPLAAAAGLLCPRTRVLPNSLGPDLEDAAAVARDKVPKTSAADGRPRLVFASGTPSHDRDFAVAAEGVARLFARRPEPKLVLVGFVDAALYPCLRPFADRIETRPLVALAELFAELARCDINLAPLELGNPFCECKSAVRCLFAAAVGVPTVASPTEPLCEAIIAEETGLLAMDAADWDRQVGRLVDDQALRTRQGDAARIHALARAGWAAYRERAAAVFSELLQHSGALPDGTLSRGIPLS